MRLLIILLALPILSFSQAKEDSCNLVNKMQQVNISSHTKSQSNESIYTFDTIKVLIVYADTTGLKVQNGISIRTSYALSFGRVAPAQQYRWIINGKDIPMKNIIKVIEMDEGH